MNKRHYEHTLPNIRGSLSNTYDSHSRRACNETYECSYDGEYDTCDEIVLYISYYSLCIGVIFHIVFE